MKRKWDVVDDEVQSKCIEEVITRIGEIEGPAGMVAAQDIIDIVTENYAPEVYNRGLRDAKKVILGKVADLEVELDMLEQKAAS